MKKNLVLIGMMGVGKSTLGKKVAKKLPVFNVISPIVTKIAKDCSEFNIGVIGTKATIQSNIYEREIRAICPIAKVFSLATPLFTQMIEEGFINEDISHTVIANYLSNKKLADFLNISGDSSSWNI